MEAQYAQGLYLFAVLAGREKIARRRTMLSRHRLHRFYAEQFCVFYSSMKFFNIILYLLSVRASEAGIVI